MYGRSLHSHFIPSLALLCCCCYAMSIQTYVSFYICCAYKTTTIIIFSLFYFCTNQMYNLVPLQWLFHLKHAQNSEHCLLNTII